MLSYQHAYHAGGPADVHKHAALAVLLNLLTAKPRPLSYVESHAGRALYDLAAPEATKTGEAARGIGALLARDVLPADHPYLRAIRQVRAEHGPNAYPGSPLIARTLLRPEDRLHLMELHPQEHAALRRAMRGANVSIHRRAGEEGVLAIAPCTPRRGLVLIDPSYEVKEDYAKVATFVLRLHRKWPEATLMLWYPLLAANRHMAMLEALEAAALPEARCDEVGFAGAVEGMTGSGLFVVNLPWGAAAELDALQAIWS